MMNYPKTKRGDTIDHFFGMEVKDPYRWMEDENDPELKEWIKEQNHLQQNYLKELKGRDEIKARLEELYNYTKFLGAFVVGKYIIFSAKKGLENQPVYYIQEGLEGEPSVLLDPNTFSEDGTVAVTLNAASKNNRYISYVVSASGSDWSTVYILDLETREKLIDAIEWVKFTGISWVGEDGFYYSGYEKPEEGREFSAKNSDMKVYYHKLGTDQKDDELIFEDLSNPLRYQYLQISKDEEFLVLTSSEGTYGREVLYKKREEEGDFKLLFKGFDYEYEFMGSKENILYFSSNENAENGKVFAYDVEKKEQKTIIPSSDKTLEGAYLIGDQIIMMYLKDITSKVEVFDLDGKYLHDIDLPGKGTVYYVQSDKEKDYMLYMYGSFTSPASIYIADKKTGESKEFKVPILSFDTSEFITEQVFATSKDGTKVPVFLTYKKGLEKSGKNPTLLYGYGGFSVSLPPDFRPQIIYLLEQGGIYAQANLRGGFEYGEKWHKEGCLLKKQNVFDDFISIAEMLIEENYTSSEHLAIQGGSNGGLLIGAVLNQRPELFSVAFPQVGVMDMLRYHKFTLGWGWVVEYGNPEEEVHFKNIIKYSPLHTIKEVDYPATMVMTADHDDRVVPCHSFKYTAELQHKNKSDKPILIRIETKAGHGAGKSTEKIISEYADMFAFLFHHINQ